MDLYEGFWSCYKVFFVARTYGSRVRLYFASYRYGVAPIYRVAGLFGKPSLLRCDGGGASRLLRQSRRTRGGVDRPAVTDLGVIFTMQCRLTLYSKRSGPFVVCRKAREAIQLEPTDDQDRVANSQFSSNGFAHLRNMTLLVPEGIFASSVVECSMI